MEESHNRHLCCYVVEFIFVTKIYMCCYVVLVSHTLGYHGYRLVTRPLPQQEKNKCHSTNCWNVFFLYPTLRKESISTYLKG